jgi:hypothetical protein
MIPSATRRLRALVPRSSVRVPPIGRPHAGETPPWAKLGTFTRPFQVTAGRRFRLASIDPGDTRGFESKRRARGRLQRDIEVLSELQEKLYAQDRSALLLIFQAISPSRRSTPPG